jgi:hypothetical protein
MAASWPSGRVGVARHFMGGQSLPRDGTAITLSERVSQPEDGNDDKSKGPPQPR